MQRGEELKGREHAQTRDAWRGKMEEEASEQRKRGTEEEEEGVVGGGRRGSPTSTPCHLCLLQLM